MRIFVGIGVPEQVAEVAARLQAELGCGRAVAAENLHLTLLFAGEISEGQAEDLHMALSDIRAQPFALELAGLEAIGASGRSELLALGVRANPALEALQAKVVAAAHRAGLALPRRRFRAHVTLVRFGRFGAGEAARLGHLLEAQGDLALPPFDLHGFALVQSVLGHGAPRYEVLADYPLG